MPQLHSESLRCCFGVIRTMCAGSCAWSRQPVTNELLACKLFVGPMLSCSVMRSVHGIKVLRLIRDACSGRDYASVRLSYILDLKMWLPCVCRLTS